MEVDQFISVLSEEYAKPFNGNARRLFHGRGGCYGTLLKHLTVDQFDSVLMAVIFNEPDQPLTAYLEALGEWGRSNGFSGLLVQNRGKVQAQSEIWYGEVPNELQVTEEGLNYQVRLGQVQNPGLFLDMRLGRRWLRECSAGAKVLNLFAYTCPFSVAAIAGGAQQVVNLDMSSGALGQGRINHQLNEIDMSKVKFFAHDLFKSWGKLRKFGPYDRMIIDPPARQPKSFDMHKDYVKIWRRVENLLAPGGRVLATLNAPYLPSAFMDEVVSEGWPEGEIVERLANPEVFKDEDPEAALRVFILKRRGDD